MRYPTILVLLLIVRPVFSQSPQIWTQDQLEACVGPNGGGTYGSVCQLAPTTITVDHTITIYRSNITITGTNIYSPSTTVLQKSTSSCYNRDQSPFTHILYLNSGVSNILLEGFTVDGNRDYPSVAQQPPPGSPSWNNYIKPPNGQPATHCSNLYPYPIIDVDLSEGGFSVGAEYMAFKNAAAFSLETAVNGYIEYSTFDQSWIAGVYTNSGATVYDNTFTNSGTGALQISGYNVSASYNTLQHNHYICIFGAWGGQMFISPGVNTAYITGNVLDGRDSSGQQSHCMLDPAAHIGGIEGYGSALNIQGNTSQYNSGSGMYFTGVAGLNVVAYGGYVPNKLWYNADSGLDIEASRDFPSTTGVSVTNLDSRSNNSYGVYTGAVSGVGTINGVTISNSYFSGNRYGCYGLGPNVTNYNNSQGNTCY